MFYRQLSESLQGTLALLYPPVALKRVESPPDGVPSASRAVPSACTFWRRAEQGVFYASAEDHFGCPVGAMVMGFPLPPEKVQELMGLVGDMCAVSYVDEAEVPHIAKFGDPAQGVVYGPLADFPLQPDVVLVWTTPAQAMLLQEATGASRWEDNAVGATFGRPTCAALPTSTARGQSVMSLGCIGMRTFTEIPDDYALVAIPGTCLGDLPTQLARLATANERMREFYIGRKEQVNA